MYKASVIVTTYNWPQALQRVLQALIEQTEQHFEIIIADDGSTTDTAELIRTMQNKSPIPMVHIWQPDEGFQAAKIRNKAVAATRSDYMIFLDGDCIPPVNFVANHLQLQEPSFFVVGNRILLSPAFTKQTIEQELPLQHWSFFDWLSAQLHKKCNRILPFISLPGKNWRKNLTKKKWQGAKGCNISMWKQDLYNINGWEETFVGWGYEDSDLVIRLLRNHILRKDGRCKIPVIHLWHAENDRSNEKANLAALQAMQQSPHIKARQGLDKH